MKPAATCWRTYGAIIYAARRGFGRLGASIVGYLQAYLRHEQVLDPVPWVEAELARRIESAMETIGPGPLKPVYEHFGGEVSYDDLRIVAACIANCG